MKHFLTVLLLAPLAASTAAERKPFVESIPAWVNAESGSEVVQFTSQPVVSTNVQMEQRFAMADGRRIAIERQPFGQAPELWVCDLDTNRLYRIGAGRATTASFSRDAIFYLTPSPEARLMRLNLADLSTRKIMAIPDDPAPRKLAVSPDERWLVAGPFLVRDNLFRLDLIELANGKRTTLCELEDIPNPHPQFDPGNPSPLLVQVNRGSKYTSSAGLTRRSGLLGATLCLVAVPSGEVAPLPVGLPDTPAISGHSTRAGRSGRVVFTTAPGVHEAYSPVRAFIDSSWERTDPSKSRPGSRSTTSPFPTMAVSSSWTITAPRRSTSAASRPAGSSSCAIRAPARAGRNTRTLIPT
ncbi:MAG: hypothetical protein H8E66_28740 [Planctomycetes bacterium]|nr:hypothetical protein [Planctomycetota bacterium]